MSSFFTAPASQRKRKRIVPAEVSRKRAAIAERSPKITKSPPRKLRDESISGSDSEDEELTRGDLDHEDSAESTSRSEGEEETTAEKRLRLAERYLENIREEVDDIGFDAEEIDRDLIAERLKEDVAESKGRLYRNLAVELSFQEASSTLFRNDSETVTSIATCPPYAYTVSKDMWLIKWRLQDLPVNQWPPKNGKKQKRPPPPPRRRPEKVASVKGNKKKARENSYQGHVDAILAVAASQDGRFVVTGGKDRRIVIWNAEDLMPLKVFTQHRDAVTGLTFRRGTNQLYSSSKDRTIKTWSLNELAYVETLFGHQDEVVDVAALSQERCISVGARDRTARLWKVVEETQLVFRGGGGEKKSRKGDGPAAVMEGSMDRIAMIDEEIFVTGSDNGSLSLWITHKKKPIFTLPLAHGLEPALKPSEASAETDPDPALVVPAPQPRWITALATIPYSDVILSGSWDGHVRAWKVSADRKRIEALGIVGGGGHHQQQKAAVLSSTQDASQLMNGSSSSNHQHHSPEQHPETDPLSQVSPFPLPSPDPKPIARGVINDISIFERGDRGKDGVCVVVALGKEHRLGRWMSPPVLGGRNGALVLEVSRREGVNGLNGVVNGVNGGGKGDDVEK